MRLTTIWTMPGMSFKERVRRTRDWAAWKIAAHLPQRVRYTATMLELGKATVKSENIPATPLDEILQNLDAPKNFA